MTISLLFIIVSYKSSSVSFLSFLPRSTHFYLTSILSLSFSLSLSLSLYIYIYIYIYSRRQFKRVKQLNLLVCIYHSLRTNTMWHKAKFEEEFNRVFLLLDWLKGLVSPTPGWNDKIVVIEKTTWFHFCLMKTGFLFFFVADHLLVGQLCTNP